MDDPPISQCAGKSLTHERLEWSAPILAGNTKSQLRQHNVNLFLVFHNEAWRFEQREPAKMGHEKV